MKSQARAEGCFFLLVELPSQHVVHLSTIPSSLFVFHHSFFSLFFSVYSLPATSYEDYG